MKKINAVILSALLCLSSGAMNVHAENATNLAVNDTTALSVAKSETKMYVLHLRQAGDVVLYGDFDSNYNQNISLDDDNNNVILSDANHWQTQTTGMHLSMGTYLMAGDYYLSVTNNSTVNALNDAISVKYTPTKTVALPSTLSDDLLTQEDRTYSFSLKKKANVQVTGTFSNKKDQSIIIRNAKGVQVAHDRSIEWHDNDTTLSMSNTLDAGTYLLRVHNQKTDELSYSFKISTGVALASNVLTINKAQAKKKAIQLKWNKIKNAKSYEVQYKRTNAKKWLSRYTIRNNYTIKKLTSKKKYNVRVRALNGKKKPGDFSKIKTITVK